MRLTAWLLLFALSFVIALVLVLTFTQPAFKEGVGVQLFTHTTRHFPVYLYVLGAFIAGLGIGVSAALLGFVRAKSVERRQTRRINELEGQLAEIRNSAAEPPKLPAAEAAIDDGEDF
jgi:uncharacterized integral membrane protein